MENITINKSRYKELLKFEKQAKKYNFDFINQIENSLEDLKNLRVKRVR